MTEQGTPVGATGAPAPEPKQKGVMVYIKTDNGYFSQFAGPFENARIAKRETIAMGEEVAGKEFCIGRMTDEFKLTKKVIISVE